MTTNTNLFKEEVRKHIVECLSEDDTTVLEEQLRAVCKEFKQYRVGFRRNDNIQDTFISFLTRLPSVISVEYSTFMINETMKSWFENSGQTYKEYPMGKMETLYYYLIFREFKTMCLQNGVDVNYYLN